MPWRDDWPSLRNGTKYNGKNLLKLVRGGKDPFQPAWNVELLIKEIEQKLNTRITDIPATDKGSNNYGFHLRTSEGAALVARLARGDVNMPGFDGFSVEEQAREVEFEAAVYQLLRTEPEIRISRLAHYRIPVQHSGRRDEIPKDLSGRRLFVFEEAEGVNNVWEELDPGNKLHLLDQLACMRAALFLYDPPPQFAARYLHDRMFKFKPDALSMPVAPTREFWMHVLQGKIEATIGDQGDMIGWEDDGETVGPLALAAKRSLLRAIPYIVPPESEGLPLYRLVLEHGDFGIHNTSIATGRNGEPTVTSLYDWETGCIVPALLSDPLVAAGPVDLITDGCGRPSVTRLPKESTPAELEAFATWSRHYFKVLYRKAPSYEAVIKAGTDMRYLWFKLRDWRGGDSEDFFHDLGEWAERRISVLRGS